MSKQLDARWLKQVLEDNQILRCLEERNGAGHIITTTEIIVATKLSATPVGAILGPAYGVFRLRHHCWNSDRPLDERLRRNVHLLSPLSTEMFEGYLDNLIRQWMRDYGADWLERKTVIAEWCSDYEESPVEQALYEYEHWTRFDQQIRKWSRRLEGTNFAELRYDLQERYTQFLGRKRRELAELLNPTT